MIEHDLRDTTRAKDTMHFAYRSCSVGRVMQDTVRVHNIEALRSKRQALTVRDHEVAISAVKLESVPRDLDRARREIDAGAARTTTRKLQQVRSHPTTDFEQSRAAKLFKL